MSSQQPSDPKTWSANDVDAFASDVDEYDVSRIMNALTQNADATSINVLTMFLGARHSSTMAKPVPSQLAACALISLGPIGVEALKSALLDPDKRVRYAGSVLHMLWNVSRGLSIDTTLMSGRVRAGMLDVPDAPEIREAAVTAIKDIIAESRLNRDAFYLVADFMSKIATSSYIQRVDGDIGSQLMDFIAEGAIRLSRSLLSEFRELINTQLPEERYQQFLTAHPVFLDPLAAEVIPKQRLGIELATDFAIRSHDDRWVLIEIERPQDLIFTNAQDFRERFSHAFGQVLDFQSWVDNNVAYAQKHMPSIAAPRGILVMGLRSRLTPAEGAKLRTFAENSRRIEICTFDDLLARATSLYRSLWHTSI